MGVSDNIIFTIATWAIPLILAIVFHEVAHGYVARRFGDPTAARLGRLTLNPFKHVDPFGTVILPMMLAVMKAPIFGWARPVPVDPRNLRHPRRDMMVVAAAGPLTNFVLALIGAVLLGIAFLAFRGTEPSLPARFVVMNLVNFLSINVFLGMFNLLPIPPFDGSKVVQGFLPEGAAQLFDQLERYGLIIFAVIILLLPKLLGFDLIERVVMPPFGWAMEQLLGIVKAIAGN